MQAQGQSAGQVVDMQRRLHRYRAEIARLAAQEAEQEAAHADEVARLMQQIQVTVLQHDVLKVHATA